MGPKPPKRRRSLKKFVYINSDPCHRCSGVLRNKGAVGTFGEERGGSARSFRLVWRSFAGDYNEAGLTLYVNGSEVEEDEYKPYVKQ